MSLSRNTNVDPARFINNNTTNMSAGILHQINYRRQNLELRLRRERDQKIARDLPAVDSIAPAPIAIDSTPKIRTKPITEDDYTCVCCRSLIEDTVFSCPVFHPLCGQCWKSIQENGKYTKPVCPICQRPGMIRDTLVEEHVAPKLIECMYAFNGCTKKTFANDSEHLDCCIYTSITCPWCDEDTTAYQFTKHLLLSCKYRFKQMACTKDLEFITKSTRKRIIMASIINPDLTLYICQHDGYTDFLCVQHTVIEGPSTTTITYFDGHKHCSLELDIHAPGSSLELLNVKTISTIYLKTCIDVQITGLYHAYVVGSRWTIKTLNGEWIRATVAYTQDCKDNVVFTSNHGHITSHTLVNGKCKYILPPSVKTSAENAVALVNMTEEQRIALALGRSTD